MEKLVIIDGNSLINRAFYALPMLANFEGVVSNAVFGFTNILVKAINEIAPKYICVAFDYSRKTFRNEIYKDYKGTRKETPQELKLQFPILKTILNAMNIKLIEIEGVEADDIIGTLTKKFNVENIIVTGDKDAFQLINKNTKVMFTKKGISETAVYEPSNTKSQYGVEPNQVTDLKALMGDASDNIPGVRGIGPKSAQSLLDAYNTLDGIYENIEQIKGKMQETLIAEKELAYLSKTLATIKCDVDINVTLNDLTYDFPFGSEVLELFKKYQFNSLIKREELFSSGVVLESAKQQDNAKGIKKVEVKTVKELQPLVEQVNKTKKLYFAIEETAINLFSEGIEYECNFNQDLFSVGLDIEEVLKTLAPILEDKTITKSVYDYKQMLHSLKKYGISLRGVNFDVLIARYLINNNAKANIKLKDIFIEHNLSEKFCAYNIMKLTEIFSQKLNELELEYLFNEIEMPLAYVLYEMEEQGFKIDLNELANLDTKYSQQILELTEEIYKLAEIEFNINSPKQLADVLFNKLGLTAFNNKKNSTNIDVLNEIISQHAVVAKIIEYRKVTKLYTTYIKAFGELVNKETHKIHTIFNQTLTSTGRLSSIEPNLQNIPVRSEEGKMFRKIFIPSFSDGYILSADYSQIELRLLASFSEDPKLIEAFNNGEDIHTKTASEIFGVPLIDVTPLMRRDAKAINFGIIYGISDYGLSQNINSTRAKAADYIKKYFEKYPNVKKYMDENIENCKKNGYVKTLFGRIRFILEINSSNFNLRTFGERAAMNMPLQGTASDIIKLAMIIINNELKEKKLKSKLILQIHDELLLDCAKDELEQVKEIVINSMENVVKLPVKLNVNVEVGKNWFEA